MNDSKMGSTEITEGLPPTPPMDDNRVESAEHDLRVNEPSAMDVFFAWERRRIVYNIILSPYLVVFASGFRAGEEFAWKFFLTSWFALNISFCSSPTLEGYLCWFGLPRALSRQVVFVVIILGSLAAPVLGVLWVRW